VSNILFLPTRYFPSISGAEFYLQRIAEILSKKYNYKVDIFTSNAIDFKALRDSHGKIIQKSDKYFDQVNHLKINRFPIKYEISTVAIINKLKKIDSYNALNISDDCLSDLIKNGPYMDDLIEHFIKLGSLKYDLVHATFFPYFNLLISLIIGKQNNIPAVCTPFFHFSNPRYLESSMMEVLAKFDLLIACTNLEKQFLIDNLNISYDKIEVIPMGVDFDRFQQIHVTTFKNFYFKEHFFKSKEKKYKMVLYCGYKNYEKGSISILKAIPHILKKIRKVYFVFIGPPTMAFNRELSNLKKLAKTRIINFTPANLNGYYDKKKLTAFKETDIFLMPSRTDAFGIAFLEAWASGKPTIGANIGATPEVINNNIDGLLVEFDNPLDIAEKVVRLLKNNRLRKKMGIAGRIKVARNYTWDLIAQKTHEKYQFLMKN